MAEHLLDDFDSYSDLILSVGAGASDRPLTPIEVSDMVLRLEKETGETRRQMSRRLGLGRKTRASSVDKPTDTTQLDRFFKLQNLSRKNAYMLGFRDAPGKIPFTIGAVVADLPNKDDHNVIFKTVFASRATKTKVTTNDVREIVYRKKASPATPIEEIIESVMETKPSVDHYYMIGVSLPPDLRLPDHDVLGSIRTALPEIEIASATVRDGALFVSLDEENFGKVEERRRKSGMPITGFFRHLLTKIPG